MLSVIPMLLWILALIYPLSQVTSLRNKGMAVPHSITDEESLPDDRAKLIVSTILEPPFMMLKQDGLFLTGNDRFEGFLADVLKSLSRTVGFTYELRLVRDGKYGSEEENGTWTGMIGEIYKGHADLAVGPIVYTEERAKVVEFTDSFLVFQSCALIRKPRHTHTHKRRKPRSRTRIKTLQDLFESGYQYGVISGSTTQNMFRDSADNILQGMWSQMVNSWPSAFVHSLQEGVQRVERENYSFIMDTPMADYIASRKPCNFYTTDEFLDEQYYAFALRHSRSLRLRQSLNENLKNMKSSSELQRFYEKWWKTECDKKRDTGFEGEIEHTPSSVNPWRFVTVTNVAFSKAGRQTTSCLNSLIYLTVLVILYYFVL